MSLGAMEKLAVGVLLLVLLTITAAATTEKPAKQAPTTTTTPSPPPAPTEEPAADMEMLDYVRTGALVVAFLATIFAGQEIWFMANLIFVAAFGGACYLFPEPIIAHGVSSVGFNKISNLFNDRFSFNIR